MIEAELKARVTDPAALRARLRALAQEETSLYRDTYYDRPDHTLTDEGRELRVRVVETAGTRRAILTYKEPPVDEDSGSKPEHETAVADPTVIDTVLRAAGFAPVIAFTKRCRNYRFEVRGRCMLATLATVPELGDAAFVELETMTEPAGLVAALTEVRAVLAELGVAESDLTSELYTEAVARARRDG